MFAVFAMLVNAWWLNHLTVKKSAYDLRRPISITGTAIFALQKAFTRSRSCIDGSD